MSSVTVHYNDYIVFINNKIIFIQSKCRPQNCATRLEHISGRGGITKLGGNSTTCVCNSDGSVASCQKNAVAVLLSFVVFLKTAVAVVLKLITAVAFIT